MHSMSDSKAALEAAGPLRSVRVVLPGTGDEFDIVRPRDVDALLDAAVDDPEQNLPYWAEIWPSGVALAAAILQRPDRLRGKRVLELGCGLGVTAIAAMRAGADLLVTDYSVAALALCALNCHAATGREPNGLQTNWRSPGPDLLAAVEVGFPLVLAADVLYERRDVEPLLDLMERLVLPGGDLWLAEPGRAAAAEFIAEIEQRGWLRESVSCAGPWPETEENRKAVVVGIHRLTRDAR